MKEELQVQGFQLSRPKVAWIMKAAGIRAVRSRKFVVITDSKQLISQSLTTRQLIENQQHNVHFLLILSVIFCKVIYKLSKSLQKMKGNCLIKINEIYSGQF